MVLFPVLLFWGVGGEEFAEGGAGAEEAAFDGAEGELEDVGDLVVVAFLDVTEDDDGAGVGVEGGECEEEAFVFEAGFGVECGVEFGVLGELEAETSGLAAEGRVGVGVAIESGGAAVFGGAAMGEGEVDGDAEEPGVEGGFSFEFGDVLQTTDECFMYAVGGIVGMGDDAEDDGEETVLIAVDEFFHGGPVSSAELGEGLLVEQRVGIARGDDVG